MSTQNERRARAITRLTTRVERAEVAVKAMREALNDCRIELLCQGNPHGLANKATAALKLVEGGE